MQPWREAAENEQTLMGSPNNEIPAAINKRGWVSETEDWSHDAFLKHGMNER